MPRDDRGPRWLPRGACALVTGLALVACRGDASTVCPAVGWSSTLTVEFAEDWPSVEGGVSVRCIPACTPDLLEDTAAEATSAAERLAGASLTVSYILATPRTVTLTVLARGGTALAVVDADVDWRRVGGSKECGGPMEATVVVPAP